MTFPENASEAPAPLGALTPEALELVRASKSANTLRAYRGALAALQAWLGGREATDAAVADYLGHLDAQGRAASSASMLAAALRFAARGAGRPDPLGPLSRAALAGFRRKAAGRGRGQAAPLTADAAAAILATACLPRRRGRGMESEATAQRRGALDRAIVALLFHAGLRRSEAAAIAWGDVADAPDVPGALLVTIRASKTDPAGERADVRLVKGDCAAAVRAIRPAGDCLSDPVLGGISAATVGRRIAAAARAAGIEGRITAHSGRVGLASELTRRGASVQEVMLAGSWTTSRMVAHYSAGARAGSGAVAKYL